MPLVQFFMLTYAVTWALWAAAWLISGRASQLWFLPGTIAPALVALGLTARADGAPGVRALLAKILDAPARARWYLFAAGYMAAIKLTVALIHRVAVGAWPRFGDEPWYLIVGAMVISTPVQAGEEIGWRGFALPRLAERFGLARASLVLGVIWATWHLPLFFVPGADTFHQSFPLYLAQVTALSVAMGWLWGNTNGSLLLVMLMHSAVNQSIGIVRSASAVVTDPLTTRPTLVGWLTVSLLWVCAGFFLVRMPRGAQSVPSASSGGSA